MNTASSAPISVSGITNAAAISARGAFTCALLSNGGVECWGDNDHDQLGNGQKTELGEGSPTPVAVVGLG